MTTRGLLAILVAGLCSTAYAQPAPPPAPQPAGKGDAKTLMQSGVKLLEAKDYVTALAVFKDAYKQFRSAKILLNIGTTLKLLERNADAANAYQQYLDSQDADPARRAEVAEVIADLDKSLGRLEVSVTPADAEVEFTDEWIPLARAKLWRVTPGSFTVQARKDGFKPDSKTANIVAGEKTAIVITLEAIAAPVGKPVFITAPRDHEDLPPTIEPDQPRSRIGVVAGAHVSVLPKLGSAILIGATFDATEQLSIDAALMLGPGLVSKGMATLPPPSYGGYIGASFAFLDGELRPRVSGGFPVFASNGARFALRAAGGIEYLASKRFAVTLDLGLEYSLNPENDIHTIALVPSLGATGRM